MHIVRKLKTTELSLLTQLFNYKNVDEMIPKIQEILKPGLLIFSLYLTVIKLSGTLCNEVLPIFLYKKVTLSA